MNSKTIIIGYGNIYRADDGVAFAIINELRRQLGQKLLEEGDTGLDELTGENDSIFLLQLVPEIMELLAGYNKIIFVDAHVGLCRLARLDKIGNGYGHHHGNKNHGPQNSQIPRHQARDGQSLTGEGAPGMFYF